MRRLASLGALVVLACGGARPLRPMLHHDAPPSYVAGVGTRWTSPAPIVAIAVLDATTGVVMMRGGALAKVALTDGAVTAGLDALPAAATWQHLAWLGDALYAVGRAGPELRLARLDPTSLAATEVAAPADAGPITELVIAPGGAHAWACEGRDRGVVYDASWRRGPVVALDGCGLARFTSPDRVLLGAYAAVVRAIAIADGAMTRATDAEVAAAVGVGVAWRADGAEATWIRGDRLAIAAPGTPPRWLDLPATTTRVARGPAGAPTLLTFGGYHLGALDDGAAEVRTRTDGHLGPVVAVAPRSGQVISLAERVLAWDAGGVRARGPAATRLHVGDPERPVLLAADEHLWSWTPGQAPTRLGEALAPSSIDRAGDTIALDDLYMLTRLRRGEVERWFAFTDDALVADLDVATGRVGFELPGGFVVARPDDGVAVPVPLLACEGAGYLRLTRGQPRAIVREEPGARLVDTTTGAILASLDVADDQLGDAATVGADEVALLAADAVLLWHPAARTLRRWPLDPAGGPAVLGVSPDAAELAVGYDDGHVLWTRLDEVRAAPAAPAPTGPTTPAACPDAAPLPASLRDLRPRETP